MPDTKRSPEELLRLVEALTKDYRVLMQPRSDPASRLDYRDLAEAALLPLLEAVVGSECQCLESVITENPGAIGAPVYKTRMVCLRCVALAAVDAALGEV